MYVSVELWRRLPKEEEVEVERGWWLDVRRVADLPRLTRLIDKTAVRFRAEHKPLNVEVGGEKTQSFLCV